MTNTKATKNKSQTGTTPKSNAGGSEKPKGKMYFVWLKTKAYIEADERLDPGVYGVTEVPERLSKLTREDCEVFEGEVPTKRLYAIARWAGINPDGVDPEDILAKVIQTKMSPKKSRGR